MGFGVREPWIWSPTLSLTESQSLLLWNGKMVLTLLGCCENHTMDAQCLEEMSLENMEVRLLPLLQVYCCKPRSWYYESSGPQCSWGSSSYLYALRCMLDSCGKASVIWSSYENGGSPEPHCQLGCNWNKPSIHFQSPFPGLPVPITTSTKSPADVWNR